MAINKAKFDALPAEQQTALVEAAKEAGKYQRQLNLENEQKIIDSLKKAGIEFVDNLDTTPFKDAVSAETRKAFIEKNGDGLVKAIDALRSKNRATKCSVKLTSHESCEVQAVKIRKIFTHLSSKEEQMAQPILSMQHIIKRFGSHTAVNDVSLDIHSGEIVALLGENGAGKSTLIKILAGIYDRDEGDILFHNQKIQSAHAIEKGNKKPIAFIHQDLGLIEWMTIAENMHL